jgi:hypothetical protein
LNQTTEDGPQVTVIQLLRKSIRFFATLSFQFGIQVKGWYQGNGSPIPRGIIGQKHDTLGALFIDSSMMVPFVTSEKRGVTNHTNAQNELELHRPTDKGGLKL